MSLTQLRRIFFYEGLIISGTGGIIGLALGLLLVWLQQQYGLIEVGSGYIVEAYPVALQGQDVLQVAATVFLLSLVASYFTSRRLKQAHLHQA
jgi:lipoprotein-releasing system permease protein